MGGKLIGCDVEGKSRGCDVEGKTREDCIDDEVDEISMHSLMDSNSTFLWLQKYCRNLVNFNAN